MDQVIEINEIEQLGVYSDPWQRLLSQTPAASFFQTLEWLQIYWRHYGANQDLRVLVVQRDGEPIGIVPLVVRHESRRLAKIRVLTYPLHDWGSFYGPIGPDPAEALRAAMLHVRSSPRNWDMIDLRWIPRGDASNRAASNFTADAMSEAGYSAYEYEWKRVAVIDTTGTWESYLAARKPSLRGSIRRYERRLADLGDVHFERYRPRGATSADDDPRWEDYDACVDLARKSWQGGSDNGTTLSHEAISAFLRETHAAAAQHGCLDMNLLKLDGQLIAFAYNYHHGGAVHGLRIGYDPAYAKVGAGKVMWARTFQNSFRCGDRVYDIGPDSLPIKKNWLTRVLPVMAYAHYPPLAAKTQLLRLAQWMRDLRRQEDDVSELAPA